MPRSLLYRLVPELADKRDVRHVSEREAHVGFAPLDGFDVADRPGAFQNSDIHVGHRLPIRAAQRVAKRLEPGARAPGRELYVRRGASAGISGARHAAAEIGECGDKHAQPAG